MQSGMYLPALDLVARCRESRKRLSDRLLFCNTLSRNTSSVSLRAETRPSLSKLCDGGTRLRLCTCLTRNRHDRLSVVLNGEIEDLHWWSVLKPQVVPARFFADHKERRMLTRTTDHSGLGQLASCLGFPFRYSWWERSSL